MASLAMLKGASSPMKRLMLAALVVLFPLTSNTAQAQQWSFGTRGGMNIAMSDTEGAVFTEQTGTLTGYHAGIFGTVDISRFFAVQTEVLYSRKGFAVGDGQVALKLTYFELPIIMVLKLPARLSPHAYLGIVLGLESGCSVTTSAIEDVNCEEAQEDAPRSRGADSGVLFGGGVQLDAGPGALLLDVMYNLGLTDIAETSEDVESIKTRTWYLSAGYVLPFGVPGR